MTPRALLAYLLRLRDEDRYNPVRTVLLNLRNLAMDEHAEVLFKAFDYVMEMGTRGDYLEFGCYSGKTMTLAFKAAKTCRLDDMRFYAFDSFAGLPAVSGVDAELPQFRTGQYRTSETQFRRDLARGGVDLSRVTTIPGWYDDTLGEELRGRLPIRSAAVVMIDCDLYASTVSVLEFITPYLVEGTVVLFDDWYCFNANPRRGEQRATAEWLERHRDLRLLSYLAPFEGYGQAFIVQREPAPRGHGTDGGRADEA